MQGAREAELSRVKRYTSTPPDLARDVPVENREEIDAGRRGATTSLAVVRLEARRQVKAQEEAEEA